MQMQRGVGLILMLYVVDKVVSLISIFLQLFATRSGFRPHSRATAEATARLNSCYSTSKSFVHSGIFQNKDDALSAKVVLISLSTRPPTSCCIRLARSAHACVGPGGFLKRKLQTTMC